MSFINSSGTIGIILTKATIVITGSEFLTLAMIFLILAVIGFSFKMPLEVNILFLVPVMLVMMSFNSAFFAIGGIMLFFVAVITVRAIYNIFS